MFKSTVLIFLLLSVVYSHHHHHHQESDEKGHDHSTSEKHEYRSHHEHKGHSRHGDPVDITYYVENNYASIIDAPFHCHSNGLKVNEIPLKNLVTHGAILDVRDKVKSNSEFLLLPEHLEEWEKSYEKHYNNTILLINYGFSGSDKYPGLSEKAAEWIANSKYIVGVGVDTLDVDVSKAPEKPALHILHGANVYTVHKVALDKTTLPPFFYLIITPLQPDKTTESIARIIAV